MERLLRFKEVCQLLGISYSTLLRWIREGKNIQIKILKLDYKVKFIKKNIAYIFFIY